MAQARCRFGRVQSGPRRGRCRRRRVSFTSPMQGPLRVGERRRQIVTKMCKNGPVIRSGPRRGLCPKRKRR